MKEYCPYCDKMTDAEVRDIKKKHIIRKDEIESIDKAVFCKECNKRIYSREYDVKNMEKAYNEYRKRHNILSPDEIKLFRKRYSISQRDLAQIMGCGEITITRYENGMLPDKVHNKLLLHFMDESVFLDEVQRSMLSSQKKHKIIEKLSNTELLVLGGILVFTYVYFQNKAEEHNKEDKRVFEKLISKNRSDTYEIPCRSFSDCVSSYTDNLAIGVA